MHLLGRRKVMHFTASRVSRSVAAALTAALVSAAAATASPGTLVVPHGQPLQIAFVNDLSGGASVFAPSLSNAVRMAASFQPTVRGFRIQINSYDNGCGNPSMSVGAAQAIVANTQNAGVIGHVCSLGFAEALPVYQAAGVVTISGSASAAALADLGTTIFNRVDVSDPEFDTWYSMITGLPGDLAWQWGYSLLFGASPLPLADLYYDATSLLISDLKRVAKVDRSGNLVIRRTALASVVRSTQHYEGVSCTITLDPLTGNRINDPAAIAKCASPRDDSDSDD
jgi:ABC-type branched-subunit amino acid transport system substrate-binding protein